MTISSPACTAHAPTNVGPPHAPPNAGSAVNGCASAPRCPATTGRTTPQPPGTTPAPPAARRGPRDRNPVAAGHRFGRGSCSCLKARRARGPWRRTPVPSRTSYRGTTLVSFTPVGSSEIPPVLIAPMIDDRALARKTLRVPRSPGPAGDGWAVAWRFDAVLVQVGFKASGELLRHVAGLAPGAATALAVQAIAAVREVVGDHVLHPCDLVERGHRRDRPHVEPGGGDLRVRPRVVDVGHRGEEPHQFFHGRPRVGGHAGLVPLHGQQRRRHLVPGQPLERLDGMLDTPRPGRTTPLRRLPLHHSTVAPHRPGTTSVRAATRANPPGTPGCRRAAAGRIGSPRPAPTGRSPRRSARRSSTPPDPCAGTPR